MTPTTKKTRNRAAQDATLIQIRALKKRVDKLERTVKRLERFSHGHGTPE